MKRMMKRISINLRHWLLPIDLERLPFLIVSAAFLVLAGFHVLEVRENARLYPVIERSQQLTRECLSYHQARVDLFGGEVNRVLFLSRATPTERRANQ